MASLLVPGAGQWWLGERRRGAGIAVTVAVLLAIILWQGATALLAPLAAMWLWSAWDARQISHGRQPGLGTPILLGALILYGLSIAVTEVRPGRLVTGFESMQPFVRALFDPELFEYPTEDKVGITPIQIPCVAPLPPAGREASTDPRLTADVPCAEVEDLITVSGEGFFPGVDGEMFWVNPIGDVQRVTIDREPVLFEVDEDGRFSVVVRVPQAVPLTSQPEPGETQTHLIRALQQRPFGSLQATETLQLVLEKIGETIALAFMATVLGVVFALPVSFLAARNLMFGNPVTRAVYYVVRTSLNIVRSIETLMWAIIFAVWVGLGPFGGMLALWLHTVAALGKLYSEAIESIDPGPIEAMRATGARMPQVVVFAVLPQILPTFTSFTLYRFDINVRLSTVIGLVSDAGLGFLVIQWVRLNRFSSMATAIIAIVIVVAGLDYLSGRLRRQIIAGRPVIRDTNPWRRRLTRLALGASFVVVFVWSWQIARIDLAELVRGAEDGLGLVGAFAVPDLFDRPTETFEFTAQFDLGCDGRVPQATDAGERVSLSADCAGVGEPLVISGSDLPPNTDVSVRWLFPDGRFLRIRSNCCLTDGAGALTLETAVHPLFEDAAGEPGAVIITWQEVIGGPVLSDSFRRVLDLSLVTLLMAFLATTLGSLFSIPLSFLAARNIMGDGPVGRTIYGFFRTTFNLLRSIEPMILVLIAAAWVGAGPFAGVLALTFNNIPNLGKLFSESIEEIDPGPVEAIRATGAGRLQTLVFATVPQLVPRFLAFILYQWDINIRMSTVIGFVGGGGIGQQFRLWVGMNQYSAAGMATWAIVIMVWSMDYLSARAREELN